MCHPLMLWALISALLVPQVSGFRRGAFRRPRTRGAGASSKMSNAYLEMERTNNAPTKLPEYDGKEIQYFYSKRPLKVWERLVDIAGPILGWYILRRWDNVTSFSRTKAEQNELHNERAVDLRDAIVQGKSIAFIKSGQALSLRPDLVKSPEYIRELTKLQDEVGTFKTSIAMGIIKEELGGRDPHEIYEFEPKDPIASASIGQVFKARLKGSNQTVAVKVQRPDAIKTVPLDMFILRNGAAFLKKWFKLRSNLVAIADEFGSQIYQELNYVQEANNCLKFRGLYGHLPGVYVPDVYLDLTKQRMLTMEFVEGEKGPWEEGGERLLTVGLQCSVLQLLGTGFFHSDPHRGNLLKMANGDLAYLDFGMMADVPAARRFALIGTVLGLVNRDFPLVIENLKGLDFLPDTTETEVVVNALSNAVLNSTMDGSGSTLNFTALNRNINQMSYLLPISLPPFYTLIIRTLTILEGLALSVDPSFRLVKGAYPFIAKQILENQKSSSWESQQEMTALLSAIMIDRETGRIKWRKLEQFVSISSYADKALLGDFDALKTAQSRADLIKTYSQREDSGGSSSQGEGGELEILVTQELVLELLDFLLSDSGAFIKGPLVEEVVETIDNLGLTAATLASLTTNGLIPKPQERPNEEVVVRFLEVLQSVLSSSKADGSSSSSGRMANLSPNVDVGGVVKKLQSMSAQFQALLQNPEKKRRVQMVLEKASPLAREIISKLLSRTVRHVSRKVVSPDMVERTLPIVLRILETLDRAIHTGAGAQDNHSQQQKQKQKQKRL